MELDPRLIQKAIHLKNSDFFSGLSIEILIEIAKLCQEINLIKGDILFNQGDIADGLYFILDGSVDVVIGGNPVNTMSSGEVLGEIALIDSGTRSATIRASSSTSILKISPDLFDEILEDFSDVAKQTMTTLVKIIRTIRKRMND
ncbi:MAG: cyclic nucleotide-binding domain-containing protein [Deltaproteobacteria bacterium]|nr:cyclic nucleotide-binding domain-containing protein [Deltaproteobacteria bacterium]